jgi:nucleoside-diphosphate-sugar epimerase
MRPCGRSTLSATPELSSASGSAAVKTFDDVNVVGTAHVLDACREHRIARLIYTSSFLALPPAGREAPLAANAYQRTKVRALQLVRDAAQTGLSVVTMVPGVVYGPGPATEGNLVSRLLSDHLHRRLLGIVGADRCWSFSWIDDVADAHASALDHHAPASEYAVGGPNERQMRLFEIAREVTGRPLPRRLPASVVSVVGRLDEVRASLGGGAAAGHLRSREDFSGGLAAGQSCEHGRSRIRSACARTGRPRSSWGFDLSRWS